MIYLLSIIPLLVAVMIVISAVVHDRKLHPAKAKISISDILKDKEAK
jgi:hypothetical protein